jgi:hypothetical protein
MSSTTYITAGDGKIGYRVQGARLIDCRVDGLDENLFYEAPGPPQIPEGMGGDRMWIGPEVAFYWPSLELAREDPIKHAATPPAIDPGNYEARYPWPSGVHLDNKNVQLRDVRDGKAIHLDLTRTFAAIDQPTALPSDLKCVSFATTHEITVIGGDAGAVACTWSLLMVPPTGTLICPTTTRVDPRPYYDPFGEKHVQADDHAVRFLIDLERRIKMGILAEHTTGRMGYYKPAGSYGEKDLASLIVRIFPALPGESYVEIPRDCPADQRTGGDCLQAYCDDETFGRFGEMEFAAPMVTVGGCEHRSTSFVTHALVGPDAAIREAGRALLGVPLSVQQ